MILESKDFFVGDGNSIPAVFYVRAKVFPGESRVMCLVNGLFFADMEAFGDIVDL